MNGIKWAWASKTWVANILLLGIGILNYLAKEPWISPDISAALLAAIPALNLILRYLTTSAISFTRP